MKKCKKEAPHLFGCQQKSLFEMGRCAKTMEIHYL
jgi:hypothetical protein